jgi:hypothetical protein
MGEGLPYPAAFRMARLMTSWLGGFANGLAGIIAVSSITGLLKAVYPRFPGWPSYRCPARPPVILNPGVARHSYEAFLAK